MNDIVGGETLACHSSYIKATAIHLLSHIRSDQDMIGPHLLPNERERLTSDLSGAVAAVHSLQDEVLMLKREVNSVGPYALSSHIVSYCIFLCRTQGKYTLQTPLGQLKMS